MASSTSDNESPGTTRLGGFSMSPKSEEFEAAVSNIRESSNWIQRLVKSKRDGSEFDQHSYSEAISPTTFHEATGSQEIRGLVSQICLVSESTEECLEPRQLNYPIPLSICTRSKDSEDLSLADLDERPFDPAECAKLQHRPAYMLHVIAIGLVQVAIVAFIVALYVTLRGKADSLLTWHLALMGAVLVLLTEVHVFTQHMSWTISPNARQLKLKACKLVQWLSAAMCVASLVACIRGNNEARREQGLGTAHLCIGLVALLALAAQLWLDIGFTCYASVFGALKKHKRKWSRALGYSALLLLWASAWLGVHSGWLNGGSTDKRQVLVSEWAWFLIFAALILGLVGLANFNKLGFC